MSTRYRPTSRNCGAYSETGCDEADWHIVGMITAVYGDSSLNKTVVFPSFASFWPILLRLTRNLLARRGRFCSQRGRFLPSDRQDLHDFGLAIGTKPSLHSWHGTCYATTSPQPPATTPRTGINLNPKPHDKTNCTNNKCRPRRIYYKTRYARDTISANRWKNGGWIL